MVIIEDEINVEGGIGVGVRKAGIVEMQVQD